MPKPNSKKKLLEYIVKSIVENPKAVKVTISQSDNQTVLNLRVDPKDLGLVIGKEGKTIQSIRNLVRLQAYKKGERLEVQLLDESAKETGKK